MTENSAAVQPSMTMTFTLGEWQVIAHMLGPDHRPEISNIRRAITTKLDQEWQKAAAL